MNASKFLEGDLARAEAIIHEDESSNKKLHGPTVDNFRGQALAYKRAIALLEMERSTPRGPIEIHRRVTITIPWSVLAILAVGGILMLL